MGTIHLAFIAKATTTKPYHAVKSLQLTWKSRPRRCSLLFPDLQMGNRDLT